jgi:glycosyltransferase involved in cell wall biosynthesis
MMKVVINAYSARQGGGQTYLRNLLRYLPDDDGWQVEVFAPRSLELPAHPRIHRVHARWPTTNPLLRTLWEKWFLPGFLRRSRADVLFCPGGVVATRLPRGCKVVTMFRNMLPFDARALAAVPWGLQRLRLFLLQRVMLRSMRDADLTIFISDFARRTIEALTPIRHAVTIPHGIAEAFRAGSLNESRPTSLGSEPYLLYVSRFDTYKHHAEVINGYAMLRDDTRAAARLILVGEVDHDNARLCQQLIENLGLADRVVIHGPARYDELPAMYRHAAANIFASSCENCPNILLEAMAAGRPVLSSDVPPMPEFGGEGVLYFNPFEPRSIAQAMERVLTDTTTAEHYGAAALERSRIYDWAASARQTWQSILSCASQTSDDVGRSRVVSPASG